LILADDLGYGDLGCFGHKRAEQMPTGRGFDEYLGILYRNDMRPVQLIEGTQPIEYPVVQATLTRRYTARALDFIERNRSKPFFDLHNDPGEQTDVAAQHPDIVAQLKASYDEMDKSTAPTTPAARTTQ
jgi:arylsulfatase A-like enzyme